jgi:heptosyltransferase II
MNSSPTTILIVLIAGIGDAVMATKAIRALRNGFPDAKIHLLTSTESAIIARANPHLDRVWVFPIRELRQSKGHFWPILKLLWSLRKIRYDVAVNLFRVGSWTGSFKMGLLFSCLRATAKVGQGLGPLRHFLTRRLPADAFAHKHMADAMADIVCAIGGKPDSEGLYLFGEAACEEKWAPLFAGENASLQRPLIGVNPGGNRPNRHWRPEYFAAVADELSTRCAATILLFGGPDETAIAAEIASRMRTRAVNLAGKSSLTDLMYLIRRCDLLLTNDSGPMHIAAAIKTPVVALFGPEKPSTCKPYTSPELFRVLLKPVDCRPCKKSQCKDAICLDAISPEEVTHACLDLLETTGKISKCRKPTPGLTP